MIVVVSVVYKINVYNIVSLLLLRFKWFLIAQLQIYIL